MNKIFLILMMLILGSALIFAGCKQEEAATTTPPATQTETQPAEQETPPTAPFAEEQTAPAEQETAPQDQLPAEVPASDKLLSGITCENNKMDAVVTNILDKQIDLSKSIIFVNGILSRVTTQCEKKILEPGESTACSGLTGTISMSTIKLNKIIFRAGTAQQEELVECK